MQVETQDQHSLSRLDIDSLVWEVADPCYTERAPH